MKWLIEREATRPPNELHVRGKRYEAKGPNGETIHYLVTMFPPNGDPIGHIFITEIEP